MTQTIKYYKMENVCKRLLNELLVEDCEIEINE